MIYHKKIKIECLKIEFFFFESLEIHLAKKQFILHHITNRTNHLFDVSIRSLICQFSLSSSVRVIYNSARERVARVGLKGKLHSPSLLCALKNCQSLVNSSS